MNIKRLQSHRSVRPGARCGPNCACTWPKSQRYHLGVVPSIIWWLNHPSEKDIHQNGNLPLNRGEHKKIFELPPPSCLASFLIHARTDALQINSTTCDNLWCLTFQDLQLIPSVFASMWRPRLIVEYWNTLSKRCLLWHIDILYMNCFLIYIVRYWYSKELIFQSFAIVVYWLPVWLYAMETHCKPSPLEARHSKTVQVELMSICSVQCPWETWYMIFRKNNSQKMQEKTTNWVIWTFN